MKKWIIASAVVASIGLTILFIVTAPSDSALIRSAIDESVEASRNGQPSPVLDNLTRTFNWNGQTVGVERGEVSRIVRLSRPELDLGSYTPEIDGDEAIIVTNLHIKMDYMNYNFDETLTDVVIKLRKVSGTRWLIFPSPRWKIYEVTAPALGSISDMSL